jgi:hypothetical protein
MGVAASMGGVLTVEPGDEATCEIRLRNTGQIVDQFTIDVLGDVGPWASVEPEVVRLFPDAEGTAVLTVRPPRLSTVTAGPHSFGLRIWSREDPEGSVVEEGIVDVATFTDTLAELVPRTSRGRRKSSHKLAVDNRGNAPLNVDLSAWDPDNLLGFDVTPPTVVSEPGTATFVNVKVKPKDRFLKGSPKTMPFQVIVDDSGEKSVYADGTMVQEQLLPPWLLPAVLAAVALLIIAVTLWLTMLKPEVQSTARETAEDTVEEPLRQASAQIAALAQKLGEEPPPPLTTETSTTTTTIPGGADGAGATADGDPGSTGADPAATAAGTAGTTPGEGPLGRAVDGRLEATPESQTAFFVVPEGKVLSITDIFLQNPEGDSGTLRIQRDDKRLIVVRLDNFRDLDYHFASPLVFTAGQKFTLDVVCQNPPGASDGTLRPGAAGSAETAPPPTCTPAAYYIGFLKDVAETE